MKRHIIALFIAAVAMTDAVAQSDEENIKVLIKITREKIFAISDAILPKDGQTRAQVEAVFGKPDTEYLPNADNLKTLRYDLSVRSTEHGLRTTLPCNLSVTYQNDIVVDSYLYTPSLDCYGVTISRDEIGRRNDTWHTRYLRDFELLGILERIRAQHDAAQQSAPPVSGTRGTPPAGAGAAPQVPNGEP